MKVLDNIWADEEDYDLYWSSGWLNAVRWDVRMCGMKDRERN